LKDRSGYEKEFRDRVAKDSMDIIKEKTKSEALLATSEP